MSLTGLPYKPAGVISPRFLIFGEYIDGTEINSQGELDSVNAARGTLYLEALRSYIRSAFTGW